MIVRLMMLCGCGAGAYAMLRGWPEDWGELTRTCLAVAALVAGLWIWAAGGRSDPGGLRSGKGPGWQDWLVIGAGILGVECGFLVLFAVIPRPLEKFAMGIEGVFRRQAREERIDSEGGGAGAGNWLWEEIGERRLPLRTNLKPGARPEVFVKVMRDEDAGRLLDRKVHVRAFVLENYKDGTWSMGGGEGEDVDLAEDGWMRFAERKEGEILHEVFHGADSSGRNVVTALEGLRAVRQPGVRKIGEDVYALGENSGPMGYRYLASSLVVSLGDIAGGTVVEATGDWVTGASGFDRLTRELAGEGGLIDRLRNLEGNLRTRYGYSLRTTNPGNRDPLDNFLFGEKRGHCEHFATAAALMARKLGVRTRMAYGWAGGTYYENGRMFVFRAKDAHAWVEVLLEGYGWVTMDPTPESGAGGAGETKVAKRGEKMPEPVETLNGKGDGAEEMMEGSIGWIALGLMVGFGGLALGMNAMRGKERGGGLEIQRDGTGGGRGYLDEWEKARGRAGKGGIPGMTLRAELEGMKEPPAFGGRLLAYHYGVMYGGHPRDRELERQLLMEIRGWRDQRDRSDQTGMVKPSR